MNNPYNIYNQNMPFINHTDWASVAKQWATLRADVNIPHSVTEHHNFHSIPPPPPPSPPMEHQQNFQSSIYNDYETIGNKFTNNNDSSIITNRSLSISPNYTNPYQVPGYSIYEERRPAVVTSTCETFDYNHGNRPYEYYNNDEICKPPVTTMSYTQNMWNLPPPDHPDSMNTGFQPEMSYQPEPIQPPKLFPILNTNDFPTHIPVTCSTLLPYNKTSLLPKPIESKAFVENRYDTDYVTTRPTKGLPAWIIDDMKKMKEKERKQTYNTMDVYKDNPVYSRRDEEGDVVMEDVAREPIIDTIISGKNVSKHPLDSATTETDISDVSPHDEDPIIGTINYSTKTLLELIDMLDDAEIDTLKVTIIRDSLTEVMKEITDDMIFATVKSTFSRELTRGKKTHKHKGRGNDSSTKNQRPEALSQLLGLDVYESDDNDNDDERDIKLESTSNKSESVQRDKGGSSSKKIKLEPEVKTSKTKSHDKEESCVKDKGSVSSDTSSKRKHRSKSRDDDKSKDKRKVHKKSKKHCDSSDFKDDNSKKSDRHEKSSSSRKKN